MGGKWKRKRERGGGGVGCGWVGVGEWVCVAVPLMICLFFIQQKLVLAELREYLDSKPVDALSV